MKPYPIFLMDLANRHCVVIGGGHEGEGKVRGLLECDATVTVISSRLTPTLQGWAEEGRFTWLDRAYSAGDLRGAFLVIAERADAEANERIWQEAEAEGALINVMDDVAHCNFVAGSVVRQGPLTISISTSGAAPALAVRLREQMQQEFGPEYGLFLEWMQALRAPMAARYPKFKERRARWYEVVDSDVLALMRAGEHRVAEARIRQITGIDVLFGPQAHNGLSEP
ncbi:MAG: bifunctional precorrin-2 dehydrogenase/sirohydrochlorin ferrochelatase [Caldilineaceae bacterium]